MTDAAKQGLRVSFGSINDKAEAASLKSRPCDQRLSATGLREWKRTRIALGALVSPARRRSGSLYHALVEKFDHLIDHLSTRVFGVLWGSIDVPKSRNWLLLGVYGGS